MFNERSTKWIKIYKVTTVILFFALIAFGLIAGIGDASCGILDIGIGGDDDGFLDFSVWFFGCGVLAYLQLVVNMLVIQLLNNIQIIREKIEK